MSTVGVLTVELLRQSYYALKRNAAPGVDGVRWKRERLRLSLTSLLPASLRESTKLDQSRLFRMDLQPELRQPLLKLSAKRMRAKLLQLKQELRRKMHEPVGIVGEWLKRVVEGYYRYHAVPGNIVVLGRFRDRLCMLWRQALRRRSQKRKPGWDRLRPTFERWIPRPRILHPYPDVRFDVRHPR